MCEQAARYCRDGVHKLLNKEQAKLRDQESREQPKPVAGQDSESATAAQSGNSGAQPGGIDGLVRWIVTKMSDNKNIASREYASSKEEVAVAQEQFFAPEPRRGISVILDVSMERHRVVVTTLTGWVGGCARGRHPVCSAYGPVQCALTHRGDLTVNCGGLRVELSRADWSFPLIINTLISTWDQTCPSFFLLPRSKKSL